MCIVLIIGFILFIVQDEFREIGSEEKVMTVKIEKTQYKEQAEEYYIDILDSHEMAIHLCY